MALANRRPQDLADLAAVPGMGQKKIDRYGASLPAVLATAAD